MRLEWLVTWAWDRGGYMNKPRTKVYKTEKGARAFWDKITANGGKFVWTPGRDDFSGWNPVEKYQLYFATLEVREVGPYTRLEEWQTPGEPG